MASLSFSGKAVLVTGSGGGLGKTIATALLAAGANVVICDVNASRLKSTAEELRVLYCQQIHAVHADITDELSTRNLFEETIRIFGRLDVLINNAGIADRLDPVGDLERAVWDKVIATNLTAPYVTSKLAVNQMTKQEPKGGVILNIASIGSTTGYRAGAAYTASKHGLIGLTKNTAAFYGQKGIRCNAIMPGRMTTNIKDAFAQGAHEEGLALARKTFATEPGLCDMDSVAEIVRFLCSNMAGEVNGACIPVDKGWSAI